MILTVFMTLFLTGRRASSLRTIVLAATVALVLAVALANFQAGVQITSDYFNAVGKVDANAGRLDLWNSGVQVWLESPWVGRVFTGDAVAVRSRDQKALPYHNDFVLFLAEGGLLGTGLLVVWMLLAEITLIRRYRGYIRAGQDGTGQPDPRHPGLSERLLRRHGVQPRAAGRLEIGDHLRALRHRDVAGGAATEDRGRSRSRAAARRAPGQRTRGAIFLKAARFRRCAHVQYEPCTASDTRCRGDDGRASSSPRISAGS